jgi:hypothetical protein
MKFCRESAKKKAEELIRIRRRVQGKQVHKLRSTLCVSLKCLSPASSFTSLSLMSNRYLLTSRLHFASPEKVGLQKVEAVVLSKGAQRPEVIRTRRVSELQSDGVNIWSDFRERSETNDIDILQFSLHIMDH